MPVSERTSTRKPTKHAKAPLAVVLPSSLQIVFSSHSSGSAFSLTFKYYESLFMYSALHSHLVKLHVVPSCNLAARTVTQIVS
jgi:hypothetical protein